MATFDLEQQEQLDSVKHFWKQYGNLITWGLVLVLGAYAAWTGYLYWQQQRAQGASGLYEELEKAARAGDADRTQKAFADLRDGYAGTVYAAQGALMAAKVASDKDQTDAARASLQWVVDHGKDANLAAVARLRLAGMQMDAGQLDEALKTLSSDMPAEYQALASDRRGDVLAAQGKKADAAKSYRAAWDAMDPSVEYRRFVEGKLTALGQSPEAQASAPASAP